MGVVLGIAFAVCLALGVPIAFALGVASLAGLLASGTIPLVIVPQRVFAGLDSFPLLAAPLFILAGALMETGGISARLPRFAGSLVGHVRGGMGMVVVLSTMLFSGISGSSTADAAAIGSVMIPAMTRRGYRPAFAAALVAAAGGMGILIPPCILMVIYALMTGTSVATLFVAGILPGAFMGGSLLLMVSLIARRQGLPIEGAFSPREVVRSFAGAIPALVMPVIIIGGILSGVFTVTESAVVAVVYGFMLSVLVYRELAWRDLPRILVHSGTTTGVVMLVVGVASLFAWLITSAQIPQGIAAGLAALSGSPWFFLLLVNLTYLILGCIFEVTAALIMTLPVILPVALSYGIDPVHLGVVLVANLGIGLVTPPVGVCLFVACGIGKVPIDEVIAPLWPFLAVMVASLLVITYLPDLTLWLPRLLLAY
jgi:C4-dicarboxylate transporter DctM subunit